MLANYFEKQGWRITTRGQKVSDTIDGLGFALVFLVLFGIVGSIESGKWFG